MRNLQIPNFEITGKNLSCHYSKSMQKYGYVIIKNLFEVELIDSLAQWTRKYFASNFSSQSPDSNKVQDAALFEPLVHRLACHPNILKLIETIYGRKPIPFQTLNFYKGSELATHSDTIHFNSIPQRWMCGVWVAFEDVTEFNGALHYYPGSHLLPTLDSADTSSTLRQKDTNDLYSDYRSHYIPAIKELIGESNLKKELFLPAKGDCLIWSANLLHGGEQINDPDQTRLSQVTHYFFENCRYYTPLLSDPKTGNMAWRDNPLNLLDIKSGSPDLSEVLETTVSDDTQKLIEPIRYSAYYSLRKLVNSFLNR